ncbi:hypothetical protein ABTE35_19520, partial [Acinetobacter baumannii]
LLKGNTWRVAHSAVYRIHHDSFEKARTKHIDDCYVALIAVRRKSTTVLPDERHACPTTGSQNASEPCAMRH